MSGGTPLLSECRSSREPLFPEIEGTIVPQNIDSRREMKIETDQHRPRIKGGMAGCKGCLFMSYSTSPPSRRATKTKAKQQKKGSALVRGLLLVFLLLVVGIALLFNVFLSPPTPVCLPYKADEVVTLRQDVYSFLLIGQRDGLTDTLMVALFDKKQGTLNIVSIPRDTVTSNGRRVPKINGAYVQGGGGETGLAQLNAEVAGLIGYYPDSYIMVDMEAFVQLVDALGGVQFSVPEDLKLLSEGIDLQKGDQLLDGDKALQLVRYRSYTKSAGVGQDDFGRMEMQQRLLRATADRAMEQFSLSLVGELGNLAAEYGQTNLESGELGWLGWAFWRMGTKNIEFATFPTQSLRYGSGQIADLYYEQTNSTEALAMINQRINPYEDPITADMVSHRKLG